MGMKLNLRQTKALSLVGPYYLGRIRALQTRAKKKPRLLGSFYLLGAHQGPFHTCHARDTGGVRPVRLG